MNVNEQDRSYPVGAQLIGTAPIMSFADQIGEWEHPASCRDKGWGGVDEGALCLSWLGVHHRARHPAIPMNPVVTRMHLSDKLLLRKRAIIESIIDQLKNISQIEHARHRSPVNCVVHLIAGLIAYSQEAQKTRSASRRTRSSGCLIRLA